MQRIALVGSMLVAAAWGCSRPATIDVLPERPLIKSKTETVQLQATVKDQAGRPMIGQPVTFRSLTPTMASVDETGTVRAITSGMAAVLVEAGKVSRQVEVLIQLATRIAIETESQLPLMVGVTTGFKATVYDDRGNALIAGEVRWSSSDPAVFTVDERGNVKTIEEGKGTLTAHAAGIQGSTEIVVKHEELHEDGTLSQ